MAHSNKSISAKKPKKPRPDWPLYAHASKRWAKKVRGKTHFFGPWNDPQAAIEKWLDQKDDLLAGRKPRASNQASMSISDACDWYLDFIQKKVEMGERSERWYTDVRHTAEIMLKTIGKNWAVETINSDDFASLAERFGKKKDGNPCSPITTRKHIHRVRGMFKWFVKAGYIKALPVFGPAFDPPNKEVVDRHIDESETKYFSRKQVHALLKATKETNKQLYAAILLAINTGCQNVDCETLKLKHIDLINGWYTQPRSKKAKKRRAKLWKRTSLALKTIIAGRNLGSNDLVFIGANGGRWAGRNCLSKEFAIAKSQAGIEIAGSGFQWLRHTFITEATQTGDLIAVQLACGHAPRSTTQNYVHHVMDPRLVAISRVVDSWLSRKGRPKNGRNSLDNG